MFPDPLWIVFGIELHPYFVIYILAIAAALSTGYFLTRERGFSLRGTADVTILGAVVLILGFRIFEAVERWSEPLVSEITGLGSATLMIGLHSWLLVLFLIAVGYCLCRLHPEAKSRTFQALDILFPPLALSQAIARLGCFSAGCCYGSPAQALPWGISYINPASACPIHNTPLHPVQIYSAAGDALIFILLIAVRNKKFFEGKLLPLYLALYSALRLTVDSFRGDFVLYLWKLSLSQLISILILLSAGSFLLNKFIRQRG